MVLLSLPAFMCVAALVLLGVVAWRKLHPKGEEHVVTTRDMLQTALLILGVSGVVAGVIWMAYS